MPTRPLPTATAAKLTAGLLVASLIGMLVTIVLIASAQSASGRFQQADIAVERYLSSLKDAQTAYRGFVIVGSEAYLEPYTEARSAFDRNSKAVGDSLTNAGIADGTAQTLLSDGDAVMAYAQEVIATRRNSWMESRDAVATGRGKALMDAARGSAEVAQTRARAQQQTSAQHLSGRYLPLLLGCLACLILSSVVLARLARRSRRSEARARTLLADVFERAPVGLALVDGRGRVLQANQSFATMIGEGGSARLFEVSLAQAAPSVGPQLQARIDEAMAGGTRDTAVDLDLIDVDDPGGAKCLKVDVFRTVLVREDGTEQAGAGIVVNDLTRQREWETELSDAKEAAESANRAKSAFIANMSHELRTPLTAVLGYCDLIEEDVQDLGQESILADLRKINVNARHLLGLINDVLDLSKIEAQKMDVHPVEFEVTTLLSELESACTSLVEKNGNQLTTTAADSHVRLFTDDLKLRQILINLVGNAAKFTKDGTVAVTVVGVDVQGVAHTRFEVADTGIGMTPQQVNGLFERFSQADVTTTRKYGGTGLGLALTRALALMLGGNVTVESEQGRGTTFSVTLPSRWVPPSLESVAASTDTAEGGAAPAEGTSADPTGQTILVIDDEASARELLQRHLTKEGFSVSVATSGTQALEMLKTLRPTAVLLDVMLPGMDGWHVLKAIRSNPKIAHTPVIMQTALGDERFAYAMGASGYLRKPIKRSALSQAINDACAAESPHDVLIVDDDVAANKRLTTLLEREGWTVASATNGAQALASMRSRLPALVLVDLVMPAMDGHAFVREVRNNQQWDAVALVVMTSEDIQSTRVRRLEKDTDAILQKGSMPLAELAADLRRYAQPRLPVPTLPGDDEPHPIP